MMTEKQTIESGRKDVSSLEGTTLKLKNNKNFRLYCKNNKTIIMTEQDEWLKFWLNVKFNYVRESGSILFRIDRLPLGLINHLITYFKSSRGK